MRATFILALAVTIPTRGTTGSGAEGDQEARAIVQKAVKAAGGAAKLERLKAATMKIKGPFQYGTQVVNFTGEGSFADHDRFMIEGSADAQRMRMVMAQQSAWFKHGDKVEEVHVAAFDGLKSVVYATRAAMSIVPLEGGAVTMAHGGESKVGDRPAVIVKARHKEHGAMDFYFDKETGLPAKVATRAKILVDEMLTYECVFADYKEVDGLKHPTQITFVVEVQGQKMSFDGALSSIAAAAKLKDGLFAKPE